MTSIGNDAFRDCTNLKRIIVDNDEERIRITGLLNDPALAAKIITKAEVEKLQRPFAEKRLPEIGNLFNKVLHAHSQESRALRRFPWKEAKSVASFLNADDQLSLVIACIFQSNIRFRDEPIMNDSMSEAEVSAAIKAYRPFEQASSIPTGVSAGAGASDAKAGAGAPSAGAGR